MASALAGCVFVIDQCVPLKKKVELIKTIKSNGGASVYSVSDKSTHLVTTQEGFDNDSSKVAQALQIGVAVVNKEFIFESVAKGSRQPENQYYFSPNASGPASAKEHAPAVQNASLPYPASLKAAASNMPLAAAQQKVAPNQQPKPAPPVNQQKPTLPPNQFKTVPSSTHQQKQPAWNPAQPKPAPNPQPNPSHSKPPPSYAKPPLANTKPPQNGAATTIPMRPPPGFAPMNKPGLLPKVSYAEAVSRSVPDYTSGSGTEGGRFHSEIESDDQLTQDESDLSEPEEGQSDLEEAAIEPHRPIELNFEQLPKALQDQIQRTEALQNKKAAEAVQGSSYFNQRNFKSRPDHNRGFARNWNSGGSGDDRDYYKTDNDGRKIFIGGILFDDLEELVEAHAGNMSPQEIQNQMRRLKKMRVTEIVNMFHSFGNVINVKCYMDKRHIFVTYDTRQSAINAIQSMKPVEVRKHKINAIREKLKQAGQSDIIVPKANFYVRWPHRSQDSDHDSSRENWRSSDESNRGRHIYHHDQLIGLRNKSLMHSDYASSSYDFSEELTESSATSDSAPHTHDPESALDTEHRTDSGVDGERRGDDEDQSNASDNSVKIISPKKRQNESELAKSSSSSPLAAVSRHRRRTSQHTQSPSNREVENRDWFWLWSKAIIVIQILMIIGAVLWFGYTERK